MTPERWKQIETLYQAARELEEAERKGFLRQACDGDDALRREVESLLGYEGQAAEFIESPALDLAARELAEQDSGTRIGKRIGSYEVLSLLGRGGMGEVYLAADERLDRKAALKFLPEAMQQDPTARQRFLREAKSAALDHPFICKIYEVGESEGAVFIAMEYVQGETLERKLGKGRLPLKASLEKAVEIAEALEVAHKRHIVHRDLKPSNILITPEGHLKVMDFGLAKRLASAEDDTQRQAVTPNLTRTGMTLGTLAYMSPEQVRGEAVDTRSDIFSFGVVLYEMLTGAHPFRKPQALETGHAILNEAPAPLTEYLDHPLSLLQHTVRKMLAKEPARRYQHVGEVRIDLQEVIREIESPFEAAGGTIGPTRRMVATSAWRRALPWTVAGVLALGATALLWSDLRQASPTQQPVSRFSVATQPLAVLGHPSSPVVALSPDGTHLAYIAGDADIGQLYVRRLDSMEAKPIAGAGNASGPFFSPDGKWIAFFAGGKLKKVSLDGGSPVNLCDLSGITHGGAWGADNIIIFQGRHWLWGVLADGGTPERITTTADLEGGEAFTWWPEVLPGGKALLFTEGDGSGRNMHVWGQDLSTGQRRPIVAGGNARYLSSGHLVFASAGSLLAAPFDPERLELTGPIVPVIEGILMGLPNERSIGHFAVSANGMLAYLPGPLLRAEQQTLSWVDRQGQVQPVGMEPGAYTWPRVSPDGTRLALEIVKSGNADVWIYDLSRQTLRRLTFHPAADGRPMWTPDGRRVVFRSMRDDPGGWNLFSKAADGNGQAERLTMEPNPGRFAWSFTSDGKRLAFSERDPETGFDLHLLSMEEGYSSEPLLQAPYWLGSPAISPDGHWIAYITNETGTLEIQVRPFPNVEDGRWQITTEGGTSPVWAPNGRELFYRSGESMMVVPIETEPVFTPGKPQLLFTGGYSRNYDISPDGQRFLMIREVEQTLDPSARDELIVVLNWFEELNRLAPPGR